MLGFKPLAAGPLATAAVVKPPISGPRVGGDYGRGKYFSKKDAERELGRIFLEDELARQEKEDLRRNVVAERKLTPLQRAERDLRAAEAKCEDCARALLANPLKEYYDQFSDADARLTELRESVGKLRAADLVEKAQTKAAKEKAERLARREADKAAQSQRDRQQAIINALGDGARILHAASDLQRNRAIEAMMRAHIEKMRSTQDQDDEDVLFLLMNS